jgi:hypothetical protein
LEGLRGRKAMLDFYCQSIDMDWVPWILNMARNVAYLARYGKQQISQVEQWPLSKIHLYTKLTADIVAEENKSGKGR